MPDLTTISSWFERCVSLDTAERDSLLVAIADEELATQLRSLLDADAAAERARFLSPATH